MRNLILGSVLLLVATIAFTCGQRVPIDNGTAHADSAKNIAFIAQRPLMDNAGPCVRFDVLIETDVWSWRSPPTGCLFGGEMEVGIYVHARAPRVDTLFERMELEQAKYLGLRCLPGDNKKMSGWCTNRCSSWCVDDCRRKVANGDYGPDAE